MAIKDSDSWPGSGGRRVLPGLHPKQRLLVGGWLNRNRCFSGSAYGVPSIVLRDSGP